MYVLYVFVCTTPTASPSMLKHGYSHDNLAYHTRATADSRPSALLLLGSVLQEEDWARGRGPPTYLSLPPLGWLTRVAPRLQMADPSSCGLWRSQTSLNAERRDDEN